jgi:cellulose biosynthesis protein BcsQ
MTLLHLDQAREAAMQVMKTLMAEPFGIRRAVIIDDLFGRIRVVVWPDESTDEEALRVRLDEKLVEACAQYWTGDVWIAGPAAPPEDRMLYDAAWEDGTRVGRSDALRIHDRHRTRTAWFLPVEKIRPAWSDGPPIVVFHSFKGGVGRTTSLAAYAMAHAQRGERVAVIDFDLDAPGVGRLLEADESPKMQRWGVVDFLLEARHELPLDDYFHVCRREGVAGEGEIDVFPAGELDDAYLTKLARTDLEAGPDPVRHPIVRLLQRIRAEREPTVILVDGRAGLSPAAGLLLSGFAHLHVLFGTTNPQSLAGLERVVRHLGFEQTRRGLPQADCIIVQAMVPDNTEVAKLAQQHFASRVEKIFRDGYYAGTRDPEDRLWWLGDLLSSVAPHVPVPISYRGTLAFFSTIDEVAGPLAEEPDHVRLCARLDVRLAFTSAEEN